ncbi:MAG: glycosyltransferase family protein, partial [Spongiibacter marinus]
MKLLYGVQGTGNGHISRARMMAKHFAARNVDVQYLFSGRSPEQYFDMDVFGDFQLRHGLTFATRDGRISTLQTLRESRPL